MWDIISQAFHTPTFLPKWEGPSILFMRWIIYDSTFWKCSQWPLEHVKSLPDPVNMYTAPSGWKPCKKKRIQETLNLSTDAENSTNIFFRKKEISKLNLEGLWFLRLYELVHKCTSPTPLTRGSFTGAIWNNSSFLWLYELVDECSSPLVEHLPRVADPCMQSRTTPCF